MSSGELLAIHPPELKFPFELKKRPSCLLELSNKTDDYVAFKVMTTNPTQYRVRPAAGVISPRSKYDVIVTMHAPRAIPPAMESRDRFLVQSVVTSDATSSTIEMFSKESGNVIEEVILRVVYVPKPQSSSAVLDELEEPQPPPPPHPSNHANGSTATATGQKESVERMDTPPEPEVTDLIHKLTEDKKVAMMKNKMLQQQLDDIGIKMKNKQQGNFSFFFVAVALLIGVYIGYYHV
ncbi:vesicle-associated protein 3-1-like [Dioscorea cayenensis subsp. rotundata]|uniref:Vesicle-associated protein 3-1-like n=1 Tax=Dioscorea cayennensis subsp. rotundata TaxID=55577 RepID=A0AB40B689_DIOCR|nr:vesicle-associated protein 3-1-like [Dioscorea cayenensis subsp. rotundata]